MVAASRLLKSLVLVPVAACAVSTHNIRGAASTAKSNVDKVRAIQEQITEAGDADKKANDKLSCWCQTNVKEKQEVIDGMNSDLENLGHETEEQTAANQQTELDLNTHQSDLESNQEALAKAEAIREKEAAKFSDDETSHAQALDSLDDAIGVLKKGHAHESAELRMAALFSQKPAAALLQKRFSAAFLQTSTKQSPEVVYGTLKQMKDTFGRELEDMRHSESKTKQEHEELVSAKSDEINTLKKQMLAKKQRLADGRVEVTQKEEQKTKSAALVEVEQTTLVTMKDFCEANDAAFQARDEQRQDETSALAEALVDLTGAEFLSTASLHGRQAPEGNPVADLCISAAGITDKEWRAKAKNACKQAKEGNTQDAADTIEALEDEIKEAQTQNEEDKRKCGQDTQDAQAKAAEAADATAAEDGAIKSDMQNTESTINAIVAQADGAQKAKEDLSAACAEQHEVLQRMRQASLAEVNILDKVKASAPQGAVPKIDKAMKHSEKLSEDAGSYDGSRGEKMQKISEALDGVTRAAKKLEIPLKLAHADSEEKELEVRQDKKADSRLARVECDMPSLVAREKALAGYITQLGSASESMAWTALR